ncbi:MAG: PAS domain S-box protein [Oculatellaceae cyanobacterium bins.114]|nr:PAS domain S-box protein [Oculatellaceae cyanobacterium bins.114]
MFAGDGEPVVFFASAQTVVDGLQTPLGAVETWSFGLKSAFDILLNSSCPLCLVWGCDRIQSGSGELVLVYNDAYDALLKEAQPRVEVSLGSDRWAKNWRNMQADIAQVLTTGQALKRQKSLCLMEQSGHEQSDNAQLYTWSYSAVWNETGQIAGVFTTGCQISPSQISHSQSPHRSWLETATQPSNIESNSLSREARFQSIADYSPLMIWVSAPDGAGVWFNQQWCQFTGQTVEAALGSGWLAALHPEDAQSIESTYLEAHRNHQPVELEYRLRRHDGEYRWVFDTAVPWVDNTGTYLGYIGSIIDITERKKAEAALQASEARFQAFMNHSPTAAWMADSTGRLLYLSPTYGQMFQLPCQDAVGKQIHDVYSEEFAQQFLENNRRVFQTGQMMETVETAPRPDGTVGYFLVYKFPIAQASEERLLGGVAIDITERQHTEEWLRQREEELRLVTNALPVLIAYVDKHHYYRFNNQTYETWFQQPAESFTGQSVRSVLGDTAYEAVLPYIEQALSGQRVSFESQIPYREGGTRSIRADYVPHINRQGEVLGYFSLISDTSDRKRIEDEHQQAEAERECLLQQLTAERAQFEAVLRQMPEGVLIADAASENLILANERAGQILQHTFELNFELEEYDQKVPFYAYHPDGRVYAPDEYPLVRSLRTGEVVTHEEMEIRYLDGTQIIIDANSSPIFDSQGQITSAVVLIQDITERKRIEQAVRASETLYRTLSEAVPDFIWSCDENGQADFVNPRWVEYTGLTLEELNVGGFAQVNHPDDLPRLMEEWEIAKQKGESFEAEFRYRRKDGEYRWFMGRAVPIKDEAGKPVRWIGTTTDIHDRKQTEEALRQGEERLRLAMEGAQMGTWDVDLITGKAIWSDYHFTMLGYDPAETGEASEALWYDRIHPDDQDRVAQEWQQSRQEHRSYRAEYRIIRADNGQISWLAALGSFTYNQMNEAVRSIGVLFDISDRKQAEEAVRQSEEQLRLAQRAAGAGLWDWDILANQVTWSEEYYRLYGLDESISPSYDNWLASIWEPDRERVDQISRAALNHRTNLNVEFRVLHPTNGLCWLMAIGQTFYNPQGQPIRMTGIALNITDRKRAEVEREQLLAREQSANETLQRFIEHTPVTVAMFDRDMRYLFASQRWMLKYAPDYTDLKGLFHYDVMTDIPDRWRQVHQRCLAGATERCEEDHYLRADGSIQWLHWEILPWYASGGEIGGIIIFAEDITERRQAEQERKKFLEREQAARREAEQANRIKDEFLAVLSHELRSPLNPILGWARLLQTTQFDEAGTKRALETIERNAKLQTRLIDDLLDISRILRGKMMLNVSDINLATVIDAAIETVGLSAEAKNIEIQKIITNEIGLISGDASRLQQVLWNLLSNAVKFTPGGGKIEIELSCVTRQAPFVEEQVTTDKKQTDYAQIQVKDSGKGITSEFLPYVFEYFRQEDGTTTRQFGGLGLGLAIVRYLTELHGGMVKAESPGEGLGATFTVLLPVSNHKRSQTSDQSQVFSPKADSPLATLQILVVDDEADMRELTFTILKQAGAEATVVASGVEALDAVAQLKPDILISDVGMPEMDGYELIRRVRRLPPEQGGQIPAIALTAYAGELDQQQAIAAGFQQHLAKPIEPTALVRAIATLLKR